VRFATATAFRASLDDRVKRRASESGLEVPRFRKQIVFERLIARLELIAPGRYVVKGGYALDVRFGERARTTQDLDLVIVDSQDAVVDDLDAASSLGVGDFFSFDIKRTSALDALEDGVAVRFRVEARLAGKIFERVRVDIGFDGVGTSAMEHATGVDVLGFADVPPVQMSILPLVQHVAEKVHAYTRVYEGARQSSRVKDLVDLVLIAELSALRADQLTAALESTFAARGRQALPATLPRPVTEWTTPYRYLAEEVTIDPNIEAGWEAASAFLNPVLAGEVDPEAVWSASDQRWIVG